MNLGHIKLIREILVLDHRGRKVPRLQISYSNLSDPTPIFRDVPLRDQKELRVLYEQLGGGRLKNWLVGLTVAIPDSEQV